ncbi:MAG: nucleotidyl transferase AbiEii/AbiGii toxin family protein [Thermodesulfobacteriota bacterium]|nr:nucleotidyl transferase AbiEii/AbiGii toxin family protein [Thermodesulfobacteriota bacterium]
MDTFEQHEVFEIEVLDRLNRAGALEPLVFGGGTMLRLCHELPRYSVDLDFWFIKTVDEKAYSRQLQDLLQANYEITDAQLKHYSLVVELRSARYPRRLKIEIRREVRQWDCQQKIAFSRFDTRQVLVRTHTLEQTMENKVAALLDRAEIRDGFDIEFLLRRGIGLPPLDTARLEKLKTRLGRFKEKDFKVGLGSVLEGDMRAYYAANGFAFFNERLNTIH